MTIKLTTPISVALKSFYSEAYKNENLHRLTRVLNGCNGKGIETVRDFLLYTDDIKRWRDQGELSQQIRDAFVNSYSFLLDDEDTPASDINWEQRRYEVAKELLCASYREGKDSQSTCMTPKECVRLATMLIDELQGKGEE